MRYESLADMPAGMRQKVTPKLIEAARTRVQAVASNGHVMLDNIWFDDQRAADRYIVLVNLELAGVIQYLHIRENVTLEDEFVYPGGEKNREVRFQADFTYIPQSAGYYPPELETKETAYMEECAATCPGRRVYEVMHPINAEALEKAKLYGLILREVR